MGCCIQNVPKSVGGTLWLDGNMRRGKACSNCYWVRVLVSPWLSCCQSKGQAMLRNFCVLLIKSGADSFRWLTLCWSLQQKGHKHSHLNRGTSTTIQMGFHVSPTYPKVADVDLVQIPEGLLPATCRTNKTSCGCGWYCRVFADPNVSQDRLRSLLVCWSRVCAYGFLQSDIWVPVNTWR